MQNYLYTSDIIEIKKVYFESVKNISTQISKIAYDYDVQANFVEQKHHYIIVFTYNSPMILNIEAMEYLDLRFEDVTSDIRQKLHQENIIFTE